MRRFSHFRVQQALQLRFAIKEALLEFNSLHFEVRTMRR